MTVDWQQRALAHAAALRAMLIVKDPGPGTAGHLWLEECEETFKLAGLTPGVGVPPSCSDFKREEAL